LGIENYDKNIGPYPKNYGQSFPPEPGQDTKNDARHKEKKKAGIYQIISGKFFLEP
jgi:hypothetical protein